MESTIKKFMNAMNLTYGIDVGRSYVHRGVRSVCLKVFVRDKNTKKEEYVQYHCYSLKNNNVVYEEGNTVKDVYEGALAYLGNTKSVHSYFENLTRDTAKRFFESDH